MKFNFLSNIDPNVRLLKFVTHGIRLVDIVYFLPTYPSTPIPLIKFIQNEGLNFFVISGTRVEMNVSSTHPLDVYLHPCLLTFAQNIIKYNLRPSNILHLLDSLR